MGRGAGDSSRPNRFDGIGPDGPADRWRDLYVVAEHVGIDENYIAKTYFATLREAEEHLYTLADSAQHVLPIPMGDGSYIYAAMWGEKHLIAVRDTEEQAAQVVAEFDPRSMIHHIQYRHMFNPPGRIWYRWASIIDAETEGYSERYKGVEGVAVAAGDRAEQMAKDDEKRAP